MAFERAGPLPCRAMRMRRMAFGAVLVLSLAPAEVCGTVGMAAAKETNVNAKVETWPEAAAALGHGGSLWRPAFTAGLEREGPIHGLAYPAGERRATFAGATFGAGARTFTIAEKWVDTDWAAEPVATITQAPVGKTSVELGFRDKTVRVQVEIGADCYRVALRGDAPPPPDDFRCTRADVERHGGKLIMTARPPSTMTAPGTTSVVLSSRGLGYDELLEIASSLQQVGG